MIAAAENPHADGRRSRPGRRRSAAALENGGVSPELGSRMKPRPRPRVADCRRRGADLPMDSAVNFALKDVPLVWGFTRPSTRPATPGWPRSCCSGRAKLRHRGGAVGAHFSVRTGRPNPVPGSVHAHTP